jgi:ATP-dependent Clp protease ATP-binding subunit ClpX
MTKKESTGRNRNAFCSFCRKSYRDVGPLVEGPGNVYICGGCVELCQSIVTQEKRRRNFPGGHDPHIPQLAEFEEKLDPFFAGQEEAVRAVAAAVHSHYEHLSRVQRQEGALEADKTSILLLGPSRSSKLFLARFLAHLFDVPFAHGDARTALQADASGEEGGSILYKLLGASEFNIEAAQRGIVYLDGIEQQEVQERLFEMLQGKATDLSPHDLQMDLTNTLLIGGGQFLGLDKVRREPEDLIRAEDLIACGMAPGLARRFKVVVALGALDENTLLRIVAHPDLNGLFGIDA